MLTRADSYEAVCQAFRWEIPARYNMARDVCDRHADEADRPALIYVDSAGAVRRYGFREIRRLADRLANAFEAHGVGAGDRIAILLPQCPETAVAHVAAWKLGAVSLPLFTLFGEDALEYRLADSGARVLVTDRANLAKVAPLRDRLPELRHVFVADGAAEDEGGAIGLAWALERARDRFVTRDTAAEDPAFLIYTSGTTGQPKGALHAHRSMIGHMPANEFYHDFFPQPGDLFWTPADWAWIGGLMDALMPSWFHGVPVLAFRARKFDPEEAFAMLAEHRVRNAFLPPTALKLMRQVSDPRRWARTLRSVFSGGETMGEELLAWGRDVLGVTISEGYGQTECNLMVGNCPSLMKVKPGSMGRAVPGHRVEIVDDAGAVLPAGTVGNIAFGAPDPVMMLEYWRRPEATRDKFVGQWMLSGDQGRKDEDGYFWFLGRGDDVITSAGYRIGPGEIEDCLMKHPAVGIAAAIG
ncbi:MAG TPA: AMP-binding protein, partial [Alphaproteobacteria bacterium]|nr:AMP-binding protein [Alphaproteobacteria bacterium]